MAGNTGFLSTSELDFNTLKQSLKTYLQGQSRFSDYDFDGSNINVLLDVLTYNTYINNFYLNMIGSEMFLDTAQLRESAVSHAKELNYIPRSRTSAKAVVNVTITPTDTPNYIVIPKFQKFTTTVDNTTLTFSTAAETLVYPVGSVYTAANLEIYEGSIVTEFFTVSNTSQFVLQSENIDTTSLEVTVITSNTDSTNSIWTKAETLFGLTDTSNVYFVQGYSSNQYELVFGDGVLGRALTNGNLVKVIYRDTLGDLGNGAYAFAKSNNIQGYSSITISSVAAAVDGSERESISSIKFNAPRFFTTQERAVTALDYANLTKARFPQLQAVNAYGGEELDPPQYGRVAISVKPFGTTGLISNSLKNQIVNYLTEKNLTTEPIIVDPEYFYVDVECKVRYNPSVTTNSPAQVKSLAENAIINYGTNNLTDFGSDLRFSKLIADIDDSEQSIISNETTLTLVKRWSPTAGSNSSVSFSFDNPLYYEAVLYSLPQGHEQSLTSSSFTYTATDGTEYTSFFGDDGLGTINIYTNQSTSNGVQRVIVGGTVGTVDYVTGEVEITANVTEYTGSYISIYGIPKNQDLFATKNKFLLIESSDLLVSVEPVVQ